MTYKIDNNYYYVSLDPGEEINNTIENIALKESIKTAWINGIGAIRDVEIGYYDIESKTYIRQIFKEDFELTSLIGNISIKEEKNLDKLINLIKKNLKDKFYKSENIFITRERHRMSLQKCVVSLKNFEKKSSLEDFDKAAEDLRLATRYLGGIVGKVDVEEILGSIFNDFCIGKQLLKMLAFYAF